MATAEVRPGVLVAPMDRPIWLEDDGAVYGTLVRMVLPEWLTGFFAAVVMGSILSTFNSVLNSSATLYSSGPFICWCAMRTSRTLSTSRPSMVKRVGVASCR